MEINDMTLFITQSLLILMKSHRYEKISMEMIARKAGVSRRSIYRYFSNKDEVLDVFFHNLTAPLIHTLKTRYNNNSNVILYSFDFIFNNIESFSIAHQNNLFSKIFSVIEYIVRQILDATGISKKWEKEYLDYYVAFASGASYQIICKWIEKKDNKNPQEILAIYKQAIIDLHSRLISNN